MWFGFLAPCTLTSSSTVQFVLSSKIPAAPSSRFSKEEAVRVGLFFAPIDCAPLLGQTVLLLLGRSHRLAEFQQFMPKDFADVPLDRAGTPDRFIKLLKDQYF